MFLFDKTNMNFIQILITKLSKLGSLNFHYTRAKVTE